MTTLTHLPAPTPTNAVAASPRPTPPSDPTRTAVAGDDRADRLAETLAAVEAAREAQLATIDPRADDLVAQAYRDSVHRILMEVRRARRLLEEGRYGVCLGCHGHVGDERLEQRPWSTQCAGCARRTRL